MAPNAADLLIKTVSDRPDGKRFAMLCRSHTEKQGNVKMAENPFDFPRHKKKTHFAAILGFLSAFHYADTNFIAVPHRFCRLRVLHK